MTKADKMRKAAVLLNEANCLMQEALGATELCYEFHNELEDLIDRFDEMAVEIEEGHLQ